MSALKNTTKEPNPAMTDALKIKKKNHRWANNLAYEGNRLGYQGYYSNYYASSAKPQPNCPTCGDLNQTLWAFNPHIASIPELKTTAPSCLACKAVLGLVEQKGQTWRITDDHRVLFYAHDNRLQVVVRKADDSESGGSIELYRRGGKMPNQEQQRLWPAVGFGRILSPALSASDAAEMITSWLQQCRSSHSFCKKEADDAVLPTRVIAVGSEGSRREPYLHETREGETGLYVALSHCWGSAEKRPLTTTRATLAARKTSIPLSQLPRTFADAILVCRALGTPYIWIDSLCIIQDDKDDWARGATRMADVYRNATLTFSADGAVDGSVGLFRPVTTNRASSVRTCCPSTETPSSSDDYLYARILERIDFDAADTRTGVHTSFTSKSRNRTEPLNSRAWCYQEWILSRRVVHFATGEILWDCLHAEGCECQLHLCPRFAPKGIRTRQSIDPFSTMEIMDPNLWTVWDKLVSDFTARVMTFNTDKLPAFSGIAGYYAKERPGDTYVAGHWLSELPTSLLWRRGYGDLDSVRQVIGQRQPEYQAPSWSWASLIGPITSMRDEGGKTPKVIVAEVLDIEWEIASSSNPYGSLRSGKIVVRAPVRSFRGLCRNYNGYSVSTVAGRHQNVDHIKVYFIGDVWSPGEIAKSQEEPEEEDDVTFLPITGNWNPVKRYIYCKGLALQGVDGGEDETCTRVGYINLKMCFHPVAGEYREDLKDLDKATARDVILAEIGGSERVVTIV